MGARDAAEYLRLARETVATGRRFTFRRTGRERVGFYDRRTRRFVVTDAETGELLSLARVSENQVRTLAGSTYDG